ncbi:hypothetical protein BDC45DRAFT_560313 [Circinella umbellata]|nr:hypothetical protein BDC45DRAFT_560313 [Circinella umbellata]
MSPNVPNVPKVPMVLNNHKCQVAGQVIPDGSPNSYISSKRQAYDRKFKSSISGAFFDIPKFTGATRQKKLDLSYQITFVNQHMLRVLSTKYVIKICQREKQDKYTDDQDDSASNMDDSENKMMVDLSSQNDTQSLQPQQQANQRKVLTKKERLVLVKRKWEGGNHPKARRKKKKKKSKNW